MTHPCGYRDGIHLIVLYNFSSLEKLGIWHAGCFAFTCNMHLNVCKYISFRNAFLTNILLKHIVTLTCKKGIHIVLACTKGNI